MSEHYELVGEMPIVERMPTADRLKHAKKRRNNQLKKFAQYEKNLEKESSKKRKQGSVTENIQNSHRRTKRRKNNRVKFTNNIVLLEAASRNDLEEVRRLLKSNVDPNVTNEDGLTALHQCCIDDNEEMLKILLDHKANVNAKDSEMWTPLHAAATCGHLDLCKILIDRGADLLAVNADGNMPYDICEEEETLDVIESEMARTGVTQEQIDDTRLIPERKMLDSIKDLLNENISLSYQDADGATPLHIAAANGYIEVAEFLIEHNVPINIRDNDTWQPIHAAAYWCQPSLLEILVRAGADIDSKTRLGETPFDLCEDPDMKQRILDVKDEIESNKLNRFTDSVRRPKIHSRSASIRRSSMRGDKSPLFMKEAKEEALHFGLKLYEDTHDLAQDEDKENIPTTNIDDVKLIIPTDEFAHNDVSKKKDSVSQSKAISDSSVQDNSPQVKRRPESFRKKKSEFSRDTNQEAIDVPVLNDSSNKPENSDINKGKNTTRIIVTQRTEPGVSAGDKVQTVDRDKPVNYPSSLRSGTLSDLKKQRAEKYNYLLSKEGGGKEQIGVEAHVQNMFLDSLSPDNLRKSSLPTGNDTIKNGHNMNKPNHTHLGETRMRRFSGQGVIQVIGDDEEKTRCCVIM